MSIPKENFDEKGIDPKSIEFPTPLKRSDHAGGEIQDAGADGDMVRSVLKNGEIIEAYPPTGRGWVYLIMGWVEREELSEPKPLHVVAAPKEEKTVLVTTYDPRSKDHIWNEDYTKRL